MSPLADHVMLKSIRCDGSHTLGICHDPNCVYRPHARVVENNVDRPGDLLRTVYLTGFERMVVEVWRDRLKTDDTIDRQFIEILDKLAGEPELQRGAPCKHEWSVDEQGTRRCIGCGAPR